MGDGSGGAAGGSSLWLKMIRLRPELGKEN